MTTQTNLYFPSAIGNEQVLRISCSLITSLWVLHGKKKKCLKAVEDFLLCYMICQDSNAAMLFSAWSKLDKAALLVAVNPEFKNIALTSLTPYTLVIFSFAETGINKPGGIIYLFFLKPYIQINTSPVFIDKSIFKIREFPGRVLYTVCLSVLHWQLLWKPKLSF